MSNTHCSSAHLYERLVVSLLPVLALCIEVVHGLAQQVGLVGVCQAGAGVLDLLGVVAVQLLCGATAFNADV
jgi:hypothetical protein